MKTLLFVSKNVEKLADIQDLAGLVPNIFIEHYPVDVAELQVSSFSLLLEEKTRDAFRKLHRPLFVDHTALCLEALGGYPGASSSAFWGALGSRLCDVVHKLGNPRASVSVGLAYTNGRQLWTFVERVDGEISVAPRGSRSFDWDRVFIPNGDTRTYSEMTVAEKNGLSPRAKAFRAMVAHVAATGSLGGAT
jgi:XTP/dITP diphosphohydrolase